MSIDVQEIHRLILRSRKLVFGCAGAFVLLTILSLHFSTPIYTARAVIIPAPNTVEGSKNPVGSAALRLLTGATDDSTPTTSFDRFLEMRDSLTLAQRMQAEQGALQKIFAGRWDAEQQKWKVSYGPVALLGRGLRRLVGLPPRAEPNEEYLAEYLSHAVRATPRVGKNIYVLEYSNANPVLARDVLTWIYHDTDQIIRAQALDRAERQIAYIQTRLSQININENRDTFVSLLAEQEKTVVLINSDLPYAADLIEPPATLNDPTSPQPVLDLLISVIAGLAVGVGLALARSVQFQNALREIFGATLYDAVAGWKKKQVEYLKTLKNIPGVARWLHRTGNTREYLSTVIRKNQQDKG
jgi:hypothetical protein